MKLDLMLKQPWSTIVAALFNDQGMTVPTTFVVNTVDLAKTKHWSAAERFLQTLSEEQLELLSIGDQDEDIAPLVQAGGKAGSAAHLIIDELFMMIGG